MAAKPPTIYVIAGCNGAGKTTFAREFLPHEVKCLRFLNADEIARGLSPFKPSISAVQAGRLLLTPVEDFGSVSVCSGSLSPSDGERAGERGFEPVNIAPPLPDPLLHPMEEREKNSK